MGYKADIENCRTLDGLFALWRGKEPSESGKIDHRNSVFIPDGIVNDEVWGDPSKKRILYVLKEAYGDDWGELTLASWLKTHPNRPIWNKVSRWTYGIQNTNETHIERFSEEHFYGDDNPIDQIAVINIKKSDGKSQSEYDEIREYAEFDKDEIRKEFELIDADIIVCGYTFGHLRDVIFKEELGGCITEKCDNWYYYCKVFGKERLFIDYYHPANQYPNLLNYYGVVGIYQQALIHK